MISTTMVRGFDHDLANSIHSTLYYYSGLCGIFFDFDDCDTYRGTRRTLIYLNEHLTDTRTDVLSQLFEL